MWYIWISILYGIASPIKLLIENSLTLIYPMHTSAGYTTTGRYFTVTPSSCELLQARVSSCPFPFSYDNVYNRYTTGQVRAQDAHAHTRKGDAEHVSSDKQCVVCTGIWVCITGAEWFWVRTLGSAASELEAVELQSHTIKIWQLKRWHTTFLWTRARV